MMKQADQDKLLKTILQNVPFDGWDAPDLVTQSAAMADIDPVAAQKLYPRGALDIIESWGAWLDREMLLWIAADLKPENRTLADLKIRERIEWLVWARLVLLQPYRETVRTTLTYLAKPPHCLHAPHFLWQGADTIWYEAGDTATDYNHYTKRGLLCGVMMSTLFYWLNDQSKGQANSRRFLVNRINNVLHMGKMIGTAKNKLGEFLNHLPFFAHMSGKDTPKH